MNKNAPACVKQTFEIRDHSLKSDIEKLQRSQLRMKSYHDKKKAKDLKPLNEGEAIVMKP